MAALLKNLHRMFELETPEDTARLDSVEALAQSAAYYASMGWPVFPCVPGDKTPMVKDWPNRATDKVATVEAWWRGCPDANIGLATGHKFDVFDVDGPPKKGFESLAELREVWCEMGTPMPTCHAVVLTGSGGRHMYVPVHPGATIGKEFAPGLDYRGRGGYVIAPPSRLKGGARYKWVTAPKFEAAA